MKRTRFEHKQIINQLLKVIADVKMGEELKMVLRMRIWGKRPDKFDPMNHTEIAIDLGARVDQVEGWEAEAKHHINEHLRRHAVQDSIGRFNENVTRSKDKLFNPDGKIIKP